jgi:hypothetical protein
MKASTMNMIVGSALSAGGVLLATKAYKQRQQESPKAIKDRDTWEADRFESVDADKVPEEKGLTQLDSAHRNDWIANGFPQTHEERRKLEEEAKWVDSYPHKTT